MPRDDGSLGLTEIAFPWAEVGLLDRVSIRSCVTPPLGDLVEAYLGGELFGLPEQTP